MEVFARQACAGGCGRKLEYWAEVSVKVEVDHDTFGSHTREPELVFSEPTADDLGKWMLEGRYTRRLYCADAKCKKARGDRSDW